MSMEENSFLLSIITPEHEFYREEVQMLVLLSTDGEIGILAGHEPSVITITECELRFLKDDEWHTAAASAGFATVSQQEVQVLLQTAEWPWEIDIKRAERDEQEAQEILRQRRSMQEYTMARAMLARAMVRLRVTRQPSQND